jgi:Na+-transporting NADH:ubiquinone oxidoreductase subunit A
MTHIKVTKGLDIPIEGKPSGKLRPLKMSGEASENKTPKTIALNLDPFDGIRFKLLAKKGDRVAIGQPLVEDKLTEGRVFVSPAGGVVAEVRRGLKRRLIDIVIALDPDEQQYDLGSLKIDQASRAQITDFLMRGGLFAHIRQRPFNTLADPSKTPRNIFVKAVESAPFVPPAELQVEGKEEEFQLGLTALSKLTDGRVHLVYHKNSTCQAFTEAKNVEKHTGEGPHPLGTHSLHIEKIDPIQNVEDVVWTLNTYDVVSIGHLIKTGHIYTERVISIAGPGVISERIGYFKVRNGSPVEMLISNRLEKGYMRLISGDPLTGQKVEPEGYLGFYHFAFCVIPENVSREFLHFFRLGVHKYSFSKAYYSGHIDNNKHTYRFTTNQHGEHRAFIDPTLYEKVMPLNVPTMQLVKAVMAEDYDLAEELGLLAVDSEDFALPSFVCPSKIEMTDIIKEGLKTHAADMLE